MRPRANSLTREDMGKRRRGRESEGLPVSHFDVLPVGYGVYQGDGIGGMDGESGTGTNNDRTTAAVAAAC